MNVTKLIAGLAVSVISAVNIFVPPFTQIGHENNSETGFVWEMAFSFIGLLAGLIIMSTSFRKKRTY